MKTDQNQLDSFWQKITFTHTSTSPVQPRFSPRGLPSSLKVIVEGEETSFWDFGKHTQGCDSLASHTQGQGLPTLQEKLNNGTIKHGKSFKIN